MHSGVTMTVVEDASALFNSSRHLYVECGFGLHGLFATTLGTWVSDDDASSMTNRTSARNAEEALLVANLPAAVALFAGCCRFARSRARTFALGAGFSVADSDFLCDTEDCFLKGQRQIFPEVIPALSASTSAAAAKCIRKTE